MKSSILLSLMFASSQVSAFNPSQMPGVSKPFNYFDPLGFSKKKTEIEFKKIQESELKHGRIAMLSTLGLLTQSYFHPLIDQEIGSSIHHWQIVNELRPNWTASLMAFIAGFEMLSIVKSWDLNGKQSIAELKKDYQLGELFINRIQEKEKLKDLQTKELNNGRLAMIATLLIVLSNYH